MQGIGGLIMRQGQKKMKDALQGLIADICHLWWKDKKKDKKKIRKR